MYLGHSADALNQVLQAVVPAGSGTHTGAIYCPSFTLSKALVLYERL